MCTFSVNASVVGGMEQSFTERKGACQKSNKSAGVREFGRRHTGQHGEGTSSVIPATIGLYREIAIAIDSRASDSLNVGA